MRNPATALLSLLAIALLAPLASAEEGKEPKGSYYSSIAVPSEATPEMVKRSIIKAAIGRRWNIVEKEGDHVVIHLEHRGYDSTLTFVPKDGEIEIYSDSYVVNKRGERKKQKHPRGWIGNLEKDIQVFMDREIYL